MMKNIKLTAQSVIKLNKRILIAFQFKGQCPCKCCACGRAFVVIL